MNMQAIDVLGRLDEAKVVSELKDKYSGKKIILNPQENPTEIIVEIEPTQDHPEKSLALAVVGKSMPHFHKKTTEIYEVVKGKLNLYIKNTKHTLNEGEKMTIKPNTVHYAEGDETWFFTHSSPGWTFEDHILVESQ
jgi:mannose-6-phosphate isomerase-like protein (cupin superfamily)